MKQQVSFLALLLALASAKADNLTQPPLPPNRPATHSVTPPPIPPTPAVKPDDDEIFFNKKEPSLTRQDKAALTIAKNWQDKSDSSAAIMPINGANGTVLFVYGTQQATVVCAVLQVCDVALQAGEQVNSINLGDTSRWLIEPAITGNGDTEVQHLIIKPLDVGLTTSLVVTTDKRTYHLQLKSTRNEYMPQMAFTYPELAQAKWQKIKQKQAQQREAKTIPQTREYLGDLDFNYRIDSDGIAWTPVRVYNDGQKTIIQMPEAMQQTETPTLLVVRKDGGLFHSDETVMVNYRVQGDRFIVDTLFDKAILIAGVGSNQDIVTITRGN